MIGLFRALGFFGPYGAVGFIGLIGLGFRV